MTPASPVCVKEMTNMRYAVHVWTVKKTLERDFAVEFSELVLSYQTQETQFSREAKYLHCQ